MHIAGLKPVKHQSIGKWHDVLDQNFKLRIYVLKIIIISVKNCQRPVKHDNN